MDLFADFGELQLIIKIGADIKRKSINKKLNLVNFFIIKYLSKN